MKELDPSCEEDHLVDAVKEFTAALDAGASLGVNVFLEDYPDIASELRPVLEGLLLVHGAGALSPTSPVVPDAEFIAKPIGDFQITGELGRGGMGVVYEAIQLSLGRKVALKVLPLASGLDEVRLQRFRNEAHAAAALHHTNIVPVYAVGSDRGVHYYAMQLIEGQTLAELIDYLRESVSEAVPERARAARNSISSDAETARIAVDHQEKIATKSGARGSHATFTSHSQRSKHYRSTVTMICEAALAIEHAHTYGVVHRDIKPANLMRDQIGKIWVTDFGLAQIESEPSELTRSGDPMGTLRYMSPEQALGTRTSIDHRTDIYSLGVTLYELLVLQPAFTGENFRELLNAVVEKEPCSLRTIDPELPQELDTIVRKAMSKTPEDRYASAASLAEDLQRWLDDKPIRARTPTLFERLNKWRRRNSGVVAAAGSVLFVSTIALGISTATIWNERSKVKNALSAETSQRHLAERNFAQARAVVDTFSELSERELAYRPELQDLRRQFLETSLSFYQDFLVQHAGEGELSQQIQTTAERVERMVAELQVLEDIQPMLQLSDPRVRYDLGLDRATGQELAEAMNEFLVSRQELANQYVGGLAAENEDMSSLLSDFEQILSEELTETQRERLRQIQRQRLLPFTFKTREMIRELSLSPEQILDINRIIEETRPNRGRPEDRRPPDRGRPEDPRRRPEERRPDPRPPFGPPGQQRPPEGPREGRDRGNRPPPRPGDSFSVGPGGLSTRPPGDPPSRDLGRELMGPPLGTDRTVREILKILSEKQRQRFEELIGEPFPFPHGN